MTQYELALAQWLIKNMNHGSKLCVKEIYGKHWSSVGSPTIFGVKFKAAVSNGALHNIKHLGIRSNGRCDEYEKI